MIPPSPKVLLNTVLSKLVHRKTGRYVKTPEKVRRAIYELTFSYLKDDKARGSNTLDITNNIMSLYNRLDMNFANYYLELLNKRNRE